jgi:hypothetical protein
MKVVGQQLKAQKVTRCSGREKRPSPVKGRWKKARAARQEREAITKFHGARRDCRQSAFLATLPRKTRSQLRGDRPRPSLLPVPVVTLHKTRPPGVRCVNC